VQREVPDFSVFYYKHANWDLFRRILDLSLDILLDHMGSDLDLDVMVDTFTSVMLEARSRSVPKVRPTNFALSLTPRIESTAHWNQKSQGSSPLKYTK
jgi:hypothetical protein